MKIFIFQVLILLFVTAALQAQQLSQAEYFTDTDPGPGNAVAITVSPGDTVIRNFSFNLGTLSPGWHQLFIRMKDASGRWGVPIGRTFYVYDPVPHPVIPQSLPIVKAEYFFDTDPGPGSGTPIPLTRGDTIHTDRFFPVAGLTPGPHRVFIRALNETGRWSLHKEVSFNVDTSTCTMPAASFTFDTVTYGTPVTFMNLTTNTLPGTVYKWDINNDGTIEYTTRDITHTFPSPGVYPVRLRVENSGTCVSSVIHEVVTGPLPSSSILITGSTTFCAGDSVILTSVNTPPGFTYEWSTGATTRAITVKTTGEYYVWTTDIYGIASRSTIVSVIVHGTLNGVLTTAHATGGQANGMAMVTVTGGSGNYSFAWSNGASTRVINNLAPGNYQVTVTDGHCPVVLNRNIVNLPVTPGDLVHAEYFFDADPGTGLAIQLDIRAGDTIEFPASIPVGGLLPGYHNLYVRTMNTRGIWGIQMQKTFYVMDSSHYVPPLQAQPPITRAEYFPETDPGVGNGFYVAVSPGDSVSMNLGIPMAGILPGFHNMYLRVQDGSGKWGIYKGMPCYVYDAMPANLAKNRAAIQKAEYFFDNDPGTGHGIPITFNINDTVDITRYIRVNGLADGAHTVYVRTLDEHENWSLWQRINFTVNHVSCTCPVVDFGADTIHTTGNPTTFTNLSTSVNPGATYAWDVNNDGVVDYTTPNATHVYPQYGIYLAKLTIRNTDSCFASVLREVVVSPAIDTSLIVTGSLSLCDGDSVTIAAQPGYNYNWNTGQTTRSIVVKQSGTFSVRLTNPYGVQGFSGTRLVTVYPLPVAQVTTIDASGGKSNGTAWCDVTGGTGAYSYSWSTGGTFRIENNIPAGDHWVIISDGRCPVRKDFHISDKAEHPGNIVAAEYYFDTDPGAGNGTALNVAAGDTVPFATGIPVNGLPAGYHYLYVRVKDSFQKWSLYLNKQFYVYGSSPPATNRIQPPLSRAEYFFDEDPGFGNGMPVPVTTGDSIIKDHPVELTGLTEGFHRVYLRVMDTAAKWSLIRGTDFYVYDPSSHTPVERSKIVAAEYFYDADPGPGNGTAIPFTPTGDLIELDRYFPVTGLNPGNHVVYVRVKDEGGAWSIYSKNSFNVLQVSCTTPVPDFVTDTVVSGLPTHFTNTSVNISPGTSYQWDINHDGTVEYTSKNITHTFPGPGVYNVKLTVINTDSCKASMIRQVLVGPMAGGNVTVQGNPEFCTGDSVLLTASPGFTYQWWPTGETTQTITVKRTGAWYVWVKTSAGIEVKSETINTTCHEKPVVSISVTNSTGGNSNGTAVATVSGGSGSYTYQWSSGSTSFYANHLAPGGYQIQVGDGYCPVTASCVVGTGSVEDGDIIAAEYFFNTDPGAGNGMPVNLAAGDTVGHFTGFSIAGLPTGYHRLFIRTLDTRRKWSICQDRTFFVYDTTTTVLTRQQPPVVSAEYFIDLDQQANPDPGVGNGSPVTVTPGDTVFGNFDFAAVNIALGFHNIFIRAKDGQAKWGHFMPSTFYVYDTTHYDLSKIQPGIVSAEYFIDTDPGAGNGTLLNITPGDMVTWDGGIPMATTLPGSHGLYVRVKDAHQKWSIYGKASFTVYQCTQPTANFSFTPGCITTPVVFTDLSTNVDPAANYAWDFNNDGIVDNTTHGSVSHLYTVPGIYQCKLTITHNVACVNSIVKTVIFPYVHLPNDTTIHTDQSIILNGGPGYTYLWSTGATTQTITVNGATAGIGLHNYSVVVTNELSCTATDNINVTVTLPPRDLVITSASVLPDTIPASGDSVDMICTVKNTGTISAVASVVQYYLSSDNIKSPDDIYLGFGIVNALAPGVSELVTSRQLVPPGPEGEVWYILFVADGAGIVVENNEGNNVKPVQFLYGSNGIPATLSVIDQVILSGQTRCYNATEIITVAGGGTLFQVQNGGSATFIAGLKIRYLTGTRVFTGGYMHGYITGNGQYCIPLPMSIPLVAADSTDFKGGFTGMGNVPEPCGNRFCYVYPNPTGGAFNLVFSSVGCDWPVTVRIFNAYGVLVKETVINAGRSHLLSLTEQNPGIYFLHVVHGGLTDVEKVIRY